MIKNILCIEDDRLIGEMYVRSLQKAGYNVDWMVNGNDSVVALNNKNYDLVILDIMLPEKKGSDILKDLRSSEDNLNYHTQVLVLTNFEQDEESRMAMEHDASGYLIKADITPKKLLGIVEKLAKDA